MTEFLLSRSPTRFTQVTGCSYPIIVAPMFLVSNEDMVVEASNAGALGAAPSLNWRTAEEFDRALSNIEARTQKPYAINLIVNKSNIRLHPDLAIIVKHKVPVVITSLGDPEEIIKAVHGYGGKVFCDVIDITHALKVRDKGCDGIIAVCAGAGGHAGPLSPFSFIPYLREQIDLPIIAAGSIADGTQLLAALTLGADAAQIGTRFIASTESPVSDEYKNAIIDAGPEDIVMTYKLSGVPAAVIKTPYIEKVGLNISPLEKFMHKSPFTKRIIKFIRYQTGMKKLTDAAHGLTWKTVWSAGQSVATIHDIKPTAEIIRQIARQYEGAISRIPKD